MSRLSERIDWLVFAEDWGRHPSTTQHLVAHLPERDRVVWVDSLGMRRPRFQRADAGRVAGRVLKAVTGRGKRDRQARPSERTPDAVLRPLILPFHDQPVCVGLNRAILGAMVARATARLDMGRPVLLSANPIVASYLAVLPARAVVYLRLDDFAALPGVDAGLIRATEPAMLSRADLVVVPNRRLTPPGIAPERVRLVPQGVDINAFSAVPLEPPSGHPVIGYWGALGEWLDFALIEAVAKARPDCHLELRGVARPEPEVQARLAALARLPNVRVLPAVAHSALGQAAAHWHGAWAPFLRSMHLEHASPLKLREYLAAGLPTAATPIPEARELGIAAITDRDSALAWLDQEVATDSAARRRERRRRMASEGWADRTAALRAWVTAGGAHG